MHSGPPNRWTQLVPVLFVRTVQQDLSPQVSPATLLLLLQGSQLTSQMIPTTLKAYYKPKQTIYFPIRHGWTQSISDSIDWPSSSHQRNIDASSLNVYTDTLPAVYSDQQICVTFMTRQFGTDLKVHTSNVLVRAH